MQQDAREQVLTGIRALLAPYLSDLVPPGGVRSSWPDVDLMPMIGAGAGQISPLVIVDLGEERPLTKPPSALTEKLVTLPLPNGQSTTTQLVPLYQTQAPLTLIALAAGASGKSVAGQLIQTIAGVLGQAIAVPVPDSTDSDPPTYALGLSALLLYAGTRPDYTATARRIARLDLMYTATLTHYRIDSAVGIAQKVILDELFDGPTGPDTVVTITTSDT